MKKGIGKKVLAAAMCLLVSLQMLPFVAEGAKPNWKTDTDGVKTLDLKAELSDSLTPTEDAFDSADLKYKVVNADKTLYLRYDFTLLTGEGTFIGDKYADFLGDDTSKPDSAFEGADDTTLPPIGFQFTIPVNDSIFENVDSAEKSNVELIAKDEAGKDLKIGTYSVLYDETEKTLTVVGTLSKIVYNHTNVTGGLDLALKIIMDNDDTAEPEITVEDGKIKVSITVTKPTASYDLKKTATDFSGDFATYTIKATASHATLAGTKIQDTIPAGLKISEVKLGKTTLTQDTTTPGTEGKHYTLSTDTPPVLEYIFPDTSTAKDETLTVTVKIDPSTMTKEDYAKYLKGDALSFENTATLSGDKITDPIESKATANLPKSTTDKPNSFMTKEGKRAALNSPYFDWTITAQTYFSGSDKIYLIDSVDDIENTHMYKMESGNQVKVKVDIDSTTTEVYAVDITETASDLKTYSQLLDSGLAEDYFSTLVGSNNAVYYTVNNGPTKQAVMIIPFTASDLSSPVTIEYQTEAKLGSDGTFQKDLNNKASLIWWEKGEGGTGGNWDHSASVNKTVNADYTLIKKAPAGNYNESKHQQTWKFTVNQAGQPLNNVSITDELGMYGQKFVSLNYKTAVLEDGKIKFSSNALTEIKEKAIAGGTKPYYELANAGTANETLTISLPDIADDEVYELTLVTEVVDPVILAKQGNSELKNEATLNYNGTTKDTGEVKKNISNTLIQKAAVGSYDFLNHSVTWKVTVNPNHVPITDGVVTDELPVGAVFGTLTAAQRIKADGTTKYDLDSVTSDTIQFKDGSTIPYSVDDSAAKDWKADDKTPPTQPDRGTVTFTLPSAENTDSYVFTFTTAYPQNYRDNFFTKADTVTNNVEMNGKVDTETITNAEAHADCTVSVPPVEKSGTFADGNQWVDWTIVLNKDRIDLSNATVKDELENWFALDENSFQLYSATLQPNGTINSETGIPETELKNFRIETSVTGFTFNIPASYKTTPLIVKFKTYFLENTEHSSMTNDVTLTWGKNNSTNTGEQRPGGSASFDMNSYATAKNIRLIQIKKTDSSNTALAGAEFKFTPLEWNDTKAEWVLNETKAMTKKTSDKGFATFLFLKEGTPYRVEETQAPTGYITDETVRYFVFGTAEHDITSLGAVAIAADTYHYSLTLKNVKTDETGTITGKKTIENGVTGLSGARIGLFIKGSNSPLQVVTSGSDGNFTFHAAPGEYEIKEVNAPDGYYLNGKAIPVKLTTAGETVTVDTSTNPILITNNKIPTKPGNPGGGGSGGGGSGGPKNPGGSTNGYIMIQKSIEGDGTLSGFTFEITDGKTYTERFVTDSNGKIETGELPSGSYTVREISVAGVTDRYVIPAEQTVRISGFGTKLSFVNKLRPEFIPDNDVPQGGIKPTPPTDPVEVIPDNDVPKGGKETFGPKTGYTGASPLWALMLGLSLAGLGYSVISLLVERKRGRHANDK